VWFSEINEPVARVFSHRWLDVPNLGDIATIDWSHVEPVDVLCGGFPCQGVSTVGKGAGLAPGTRSGLWAHMAAAIEDLQPEHVVIENVRGLLSSPAVRTSTERAVLEVAAGVPVTEVAERYAVGRQSVHANLRQRQQALDKEKSWQLSPGPTTCRERSSSTRTCEAPGSSGPTYPAS
jgi:site-specific DNA-cytosine methylase